MRVLVTGGAGFIGSHLCDRLLANGNFVTCLDNLQTGSARNVSHGGGGKPFEFIAHDVTIPFNVDADRIFNLACPASPIHYQHSPIQTTRTCVLGALNVLDLALRTKAIVLQASTSEVYGDPEVHPQPESYLGRVNPTGLRSCYDEGKRCAESLFCDYRRQHNARIKIARIFNTYGPRMHPNDGRVVSNFIVQALQGADITIYGDGNQSRSFCYVDDLIEALLRVMDTPETFTGPINIGNPAECTILELAELILRKTSSRSRIAFKPRPDDDPRQRQPDISVARTTLQWEPLVSLQDGVTETVRYFKHLLQQ